MKESRHEQPGLVAELERRARGQAAVAELGRRALTGEPMQGLFELAVSSVTRSLGTDLAAVLLREGDELVVHADSGWSPEQLRRVPLDPKSHVGHTYEVQEVVVVEDLVTDPRFPTSSRRLLELGIRSGAAVPIRGAPEGVGVLATHSCRTRPFSGEDVTFLRAVANVLAAAAGRARAEETRALVEERLRFLADASHTLSRSLDYHQTFEQIANLVVPQLADWCAIDVVERGQIVNITIAHSDPVKARWARGLQAERRPQRSDAPSGVPAVVRTGRPELYAEITDEFLSAAAESPEELELLRQIGISSALIVPLIARGHTLGAISLVWAESGGRYSQADLEFAENLAGRASLALDNARLHDAAVAAAERLARLQSVTEQLSEASTRADVANVIVTAGAAILGAQAGWVAQISSDRQTLEVVGNFGYPAELARQFAHLPLELANPTTDAVRTGQALWYASGDEVRAAYPALAPSYTLYEAMTVVPMLDQNEPIGVVALNFTARRDFGVADRALLETLARQGAQALERARLFDEREERANAASVLAHVADGVFQLDARGRVRLWNPAAARITGLTAEEVAGRPIDEVFSGWDELQAGLVETTQSVAAPMEVGGRELWLSLSGADYEDGTVYAFRDLTDEHRLEEVRRDFVSTASHELRTPLSAVYGAAKTLQERELDAETSERLLEMIVREGERLNRIVDDLLLANRLDAGGMELHVEQADADAIAAELVELARQRKPESLRLDAELNGHVLVLADPARLRQVLANLIDNAIKYSPDGGTVSLAVASDGPVVRFSVSDQGLGIPAAEQRNIFEKFYRLDPALTRGVGGTGLGLYISRELVRQMNGRIWLESREGEGSTFFVELPSG